MTKVKVTLSVDEKVLREARANMIRQRLSLSAAFEELLKSFTRYQLIKMAEGLGIKSGYIGFEDVARRRKKGGNSGKLVREIRDERARRIFGH